MAHVKEHNRNMKEQHYEPFFQIKGHINLRRTLEAYQLLPSSLQTPDFPELCSRLSKDTWLLLSRKTTSLFSVCKTISFDCSSQGHEQGDGDFFENLNTVVKY